MTLRTLQLDSKKAVGYGHGRILRLFETLPCPEIRHAIGFLRRQIRKHDSFDQIIVRNVSGDSPVYPFIPL